ncbi:hypothetical protein Cni_G01787 [Canna indica]|uniref:Uncharacterized protein n=1 Tax=Canna indica TaxID=4628 RepID=A0AAQ3JN30_9LILI|nr:hypothetical protein Cni_G01787 [Canna indica]
MHREIKPGNDTHVSGYFGGKVSNARKIYPLQNSTWDITQTWWDESLNVLKEFFPRTYTKDELIHAKKKGEFLSSRTELQQRALNLYVCLKSDVCIPTIFSLFYGNVAGKRIASGLIE